MKRGGVVTSGAELVPKTAQIDLEEFELEKAEADALFNSIGEGCIATDSLGKIKRVNNVALDMLGFKKEDLIGAWFPKVIHAEDEAGQSIATIARPITQALMTGKPVSAKLYYVTNKGVKLPVEITVSPIILGGRPIGVVQMFRDITLERRIEQAKDEFLSIISHQLRTPLTSIRLFAEMILSGQTGDINSKEREYLDNIQKSTLRMIRLVGTTLNISRIELGRLAVSPVPTDLSDLVHTLVEEMRPVAAQRQIALRFVRPRVKIGNVPVDPSLLSEVIHNLITNAVRYSPAIEGKIEVRLEPVSKGYNISVKDNGIGVPKDAQKKLFTRFFRADNAIKAEGEGTGLGLYLVRMIMETTGGSIAFESKEGRGSTFTVHVPKHGMSVKHGDKGLSA